MLIPDRVCKELRSARRELRASEANVRSCAQGCMCTPVVMRATRAPQRRPESLDSGCERSILNARGRIKMDETHASTLTSSALHLATLSAYTSATCTSAQFQYVLTWMESR